MNISPRLVRAIQIRWGQIAPDCSFVEDNEQVIEIALDADGLNPLIGSNDDADAYADYLALKEQFGYREVAAALAAHPSLQYV